MPQIDNHMKWCLGDTRRLVRVKPDLVLARKHLDKSEYNYGVLQKLERLGVHDWALNVGFYAIYHCFLAILAKHGYSSRNQSCTLTVMLLLIDQGAVDFDKDIVLRFDTLDVDKDAVNPTVRAGRELSTYGVETSVDLDLLSDVKDLILKAQRGTIRELGRRS